VPVYLCASLAIGFHAGLFSVGVLDYPMSIVLPFSLFVFPSLLEEAFFRGVLIPNNAAAQSKSRIVAYIVLSTAAFVLWHPANALTINTAAAALFLNPAFLLIVTLLGITCSVSYVLSTFALDADHYPLADRSRLGHLPGRQKQTHGTVRALIDVIDS